MVTKEQMIEAGIILENYDPKSLLFADAGVESLEENTTIEVDRSKLIALPSCAKGFFVPIPLGCVPCR